MSYLLALDAGTGSIRAVIFDLNGRQLAVGQAEWKHLSVDNVPGSMEFDLTTNWQLACQCIRQALDAARLSAADIQSVACCSMREGIVLYDRNGEAIWACANVDARASREVAELKEIHDYRFESEVYEVSGQTLALSAMPRLLWLAHHRPDIYRKAATITMISDWLAAKLSGELAVDPSNAGTTGMLDLFSRDWRPALLDMAGLRTDPQMNIRVNPHVIPGMAQAESISFFTGLTMRWFRDAFCAEEKLIAERLGVDAYSLLEEMASRVPAGSHGVMPIFSDAMHFKQWYHAAPSFINLSIDPEKCNKATLFRALEENAAIVSACNLAQISQFSGVTFDSLVFAGGGSKGALWSQILSDVTGLPVRVPVVREATALGCAIAAGTGAGLYDDMASTGERLVSWHREFTPNPQHRELYQEMMSKWQTVYADQLGLVDSGLTTSMWQAPGLERRQRVVSSPSP
ncbi:TPA: autoinducer-2 kinase [Klebsiella pneumoniae]